MGIIRYARLWLGIGVGLVIGSLISIVVFGLRLGPDFTGGSTLLIQIRESNPSTAELQQQIQDILSETTVRRVIQVEDSQYQVDLDALTSDQSNQIKENLNELYGSAAQGGSVEILSVTTISPSIGNELRDRAFISLGLVLVSIVIFITYVFRKVSYPVPSVYYGLVAIIALFHDILIPTGIFAYLSYLNLVQIDVLFVIALLSILGASVNDTIVVFDRIRENLRTKGGESFEHIVGISIDQTLARSLYTSITLLMVLGSIFLFGGQNVQFFALALFLGVFFGTYSSIFVASPLLVMIYRWRIRVK